MPLYSVIQPIKVGGKVHKPGGDSVELSEEVAAGLVGYVEPVRDEQAKAPATASAVASGAGTPPNNPPPPTTTTPKKTAATKSASSAKKATKRQAK